MNKIKEKLKMYVAKKKNGGGKEIFIELGLTLVGAVLLYIFRDKITPLVESITTTVGDKVTALFK